jgi:hypothetical protein
LLFTAAVYPVAMDLWHGNVSDSGDTMMMSLYCTLGVFLLLAESIGASQPDRLCGVVEFRPRCGHVGACPGT